MTDLIQHAISYATFAHRHQTRKCNSEVKLPYIVHPVELVKFLAQKGFRDENTLAIAALHDTIEDTETTEHSLALEFNHEIVSGVVELTCLADQEKNHDLKRKIKTQYLESFANKSIESLVVKVADRLCNVRDYATEGNLPYALKYYDKAKPVWSAYANRREEIVSKYGDKPYVSLLFEINRWS